MYIWSAEKSARLLHKNKTGGKGDARAARKWSGASPWQWSLFYVGWGGVIQSHHCVRFTIVSEKKGQRPLSSICGFRICASDRQRPLRRVRSPFGLQESSLLASRGEGWVEWHRPFATIAVAPRGDFSCSGYEGSESHG